MAPQCTATAKSTGERCTRPAVRGATVCRFHGGKAPQVLAKIESDEVEKQFNRALADLDAEPVDDPFAALAQLAGDVLGWKDQIAARVSELTEIRYEASGAGTEQLRSEVAMFERAMDRCASVLGLIAKLDIDERMARISQKQADAVIRALDAGLAAAGVTGAPAAEARAVTGRALRGEA